ncbi:MAG TPA: DEAD/DEAH box helicase [Candidatus Limnocylindrales bacterium]|nr:DEAD/DEAH box helicase [Candidatus Limnocylindrales bacterium]
MTFTSLGLHPSLLRAIDARGYQSPTPIQNDAIAAALTGRDVLGCAATGSGKTAAFLLPILNHLIANPRRQGTRALVLAPTRELAAQILDEAKIFAQGTPIRAAVVVGGVSMQPQRLALRSGVDVLIATPGRLLDHLRAGHARLDGVEILVLDEADRMLDMGFLPDVRRILTGIPRERQTLFFSATVPQEIAKLAGQMLREPARIGTERKSAPAESVTQHVYPVCSSRKSSLLIELLKRDMVQDALAFTRTKHRADRLARFLSENGIRADRIHGNRSQGQRTAALDAFKSGKIRVLVATDIAARGIDVDSLGHVVNYDLPMRSEDYIHRVGRTGRASAKGEALTFVSPEDEGDMRQIERDLGKGAIERRKLEGFDYTARIEPASARPMRSAPARPATPGRARSTRSFGGARPQRRA